MLLPPDVAEAARRRWEGEQVIGSRVKSEEEMRSVVQEFLLE